MKSWLDYLIVSLITAIGVFYGGIVGLILAIVFFMLSMKPKAKYVPPTKPDHIYKVPVECYTAYSNYLKSSEWKTLRRLVLDRDAYCCVDCGASDKKLQVHHIHYDGIHTMEFTPEQCVTVCHDCHDIRHGRHLWNT